MPTYLGTQNSDAKALAPSHTKRRVEKLSGRPTLNSAPCPRLCLLQLQGALTRCWFLAGEHRLHLLGNPAQPCFICCLDWFACAWTRGPARGHCSLRAIVPTSPGHHRPRRGCGISSVESQGPSRNAPCPARASLRVSQGNRHRERVQGSGRSDGSQASRGSSCGPVGTSPLDHLRSALCPQPTPRPEGAPPSRPLSTPASLQGILPTPGPSPAAPGLLLPGAPPYEPQRELSLELLRPGTPHTHPPAVFPTGRPSASPSTPHFSEPPRKATLRSSAGHSPRESLNLSLRGPPR